MGHLLGGSATHDVAIEIAKRGRLIDHRIDPNVDAERDFVGIDLTNTSTISQQEYLQSADPVFQAETVSGQTYYSDSKVLLWTCIRSPHPRPTRPLNLPLCSGRPHCLSQLQQRLSDKPFCCPLSRMTGK